MFGLVLRILFQFIMIVLHKKLLQNEHTIRSVAVNYSKTKYLSLIQMKDYTLAK